MELYVFLGKSLTFQPCVVQKSSIEEKLSKTLIKTLSLERYFSKRELIPFWGEGVGQNF